MHDASKPPRQRLDLDSFDKYTSSSPSRGNSKNTNPTTTSKSRSCSRSRSRSPNKITSNLDAFSMQPCDGMSKLMYVGGCPSDDVSEPTVDGSFSDEDFSLSTERSFVTTHGIHMPKEEDNDDLSLSSINTKALLQITELSKRLRIQENTKLELLNQCLQLEGRLEKNDCKNAFVRIYKNENNQLREASAKMEKDFMNDLNEIVTKMAEMEQEYQEKLRTRDASVKELEEELRLLKVAKNLDDDVSVISRTSTATTSTSTRASRQI